MHGDWRGGQPPQNWQEANHNSLMNMYDRIDAANRRERARSAAASRVTAQRVPDAGGGAWLVKLLVVVGIVVFAFGFVNVAADFLRDVLQGFAQDGPAPELFGAAIDLPDWGLVLAALLAVPVALLMLRVVWGLVKLAASLAVFFGLLYVGYLVIAGVA